LRLLILAALTYIAYRLILPKKGLNSKRTYEIQEKDDGDFIDYEEID